MQSLHQQQTLEKLRNRFGTAGTAGFGPVTGPSLVPCAFPDAILRTGLHECLGQGPGDWPSVLGFALSAASRLQTRKPVFMLNLANVTGNYTVLHAMASPAFQGLNSPAQLAQKFAAFRMQGIDIGPAILLPPILSGSPKMEGADVLRVSSHYDTNPQKVVFEMAFQAVNKAWRLAGIAKQYSTGPSGT